MKAEELAYKVHRDMRSEPAPAKRMHRIIFAAYNSMRKEASKLDDPDWEERFEDLAERKGCMFKPRSKPHYQDRGVSSIGYVAGGIELVRCAGEFIRTELNEQAKAAREQAPMPEIEELGEKEIQAQLSLLEQLEENGCLVGYLGCDLPQR